MVPQKVKHQIAFLGIFSTELKVGTQTDVFTLLQHYLQLKCPSDERIYKILYLHKMEYYFNLKECNSEHATTWMNFKNILLDEITQTQKENFV